MYGPIEIGRKVFVRGLPFGYVGVLKSVTPTEIVLGDASWVALTGTNFSEALTSAKGLRRAQPYANDVVISRAVIADVTELPKNYALPRQVVLVS